MGNSLKRSRDEEEKSPSAKRRKLQSLTNATDGDWDREADAARLAKSITDHCIVIMRGPRGSGKSSMALSLLAAKLEVCPSVVQPPWVHRAFILSIDDFFYQGSSYVFDRQQLPSILGQIDRRIEDMMQSRVSPIILDNVNQRKRDLKRQVQMADRYAYSVLIVGPESLGPRSMDVDTLLARIQKRCEEEPGRSVNRSYISRTVSEFESLPEGPEALDCIRNLQENNKGKAGKGEGKKGKDDDAGKGKRDDSTPEIDPVEVRKRLKRQVEYYFSDANLPRDAFLKSLMSKDGWVPLEKIAGFAKVRQLTNDISAIVEALSESSTVQLNEQQVLVRRRGDWEEHIPQRAEVVIDSQAVGHIIGKRGANIKSLRSRSGAILDIQQPQDNSREATIVIVGTTQAVELAVVLIQEQLNSLGDRFDKQEISAPSEQTVASDAVSISPAENFEAALESESTGS